MSFEFPSWIRHLPRVILLLALAAAVPALVSSNLAMREEVRRSRANYKTQLETLGGVTEALGGAEHRLERMTSSLSAVEKEARAQFRLIRPGERLLLLEYEDGG